MNARSLIFAALFASVGLPATADLARANAAYRAGQYDIAVSEAAAHPSADSDAFRARALLAQVMCAAEGPDTSVIREALAAADAAIAKEPAHEEGRLQKAIALSLLTRPMSLGEARESGYGPEARKLAESVLADDPANHYALGFLAVWHVEVHRRGGTIGAAVLGASLREARRHYEKAVRLAPEDAGLRWQWARALAAYDAKKYRGEIKAELKAALDIDPQTELDRVMQARAEALLDVVNSSRPSAIEQAAARMF